MSTLPRLGRKPFRNNQSSRVGDLLSMKQADAQDVNTPSRGLQNDKLTRSTSQDDIAQYQPVSGQGQKQYEQFDSSQDYGKLPDMNAGEFRDQYEDFSRAGPIRPQSNTIMRQQPIEAGQLPPLPKSISQQRLEKFSTGAQEPQNLASANGGLNGPQGRALLHDLDQKFDEQERMIKFLMNQVNSLEEQQNQTKSQSYKQRDQDLGQLSKIENQMRFNSEQQSFSNQEVIQKLKSLEDQVLLGEQTRMELREKLRLTEDNNREMVNFIKNLQSQGDQELSSMRAFLQQKISEDYQNNTKSQEKNSVLFNEMVRLGQENEKYAERVAAMQQSYEARIQAVEQRLVQSEQSTVLADRKGESNQTIMTDIVDKVEAKVLQMEQQLYLLKNDFSREKDNVGRLEITGLKNNEDFKNVVNQIQVEFGGKLEVKMTDLVNRLLLEQEERMRQVDEIKYQMDMKDKMALEKSKHERDEMRDRYSAMDSVVKAEFQRKDEALLGLQQSLDQQVRTINGWIKQEEIARNQQEINMRTEIQKAQENNRFDIENFKNQQVQVTEKLSEMIKMEVDQRLQTDKESKNLYQGLIKNVMQDVAVLKETTELTVAKLAKDVKEASQDSAERAHFLSRYIDEEIIKIGQKVTKQIETIKTLCAKLTEQFKKHLINHENMKKDIYKRFEIIEGHLPVYRSELYKLLEANEQRAMNKIKEIKEAVEQTMLTNFQVLDDRVDKFSDLVDSNLETLRKAIGDNREVYVSLINKANLEQEDRFNGMVEDLETITNQLYEVQANQENNGTASGDEVVKLGKQIHDLEAHLNTSIITEKSVRKAQGKHLAEELDKLQKSMSAITDKLKVRTDDDGNLIKDNKADIKTLQKEIDILTDKSKTLQIEVNDFKEMIEKGEIGPAKQESKKSQEQLDQLDKDIFEMREKLMEVDTLKAKVEKLQTVSEENEKKFQGKEFATQEIVDGKITAVYEKLKKDNQMIWNETISLAEKQFNEKGIQETMDLLPSSIQGKNELRNTIGVLDNTYKDDKQNSGVNDQQPKPNINSLNKNDKK